MAEEIAKPPHSPALPTDPGHPAPPDPHLLSLPPLPDLDGTVVRRGEKGMESARYQYALTSQPDGVLDPAAVILASSVRDVQLAVRYARTHNLSLAIRTGGHHYLGESSCNGDNMIIDLSDAAAWKTVEYDEEKNLLRMGPANNVHDLNVAMGQRGLFVPHGECRGVALGGHIQAGCWGVTIRAHGLGTDYIEEFDIVTADGELRTVNRHSTEPDDVDLYFGVLGGSPGDFGVVTSVTFKPLKNADYPDSRCLKLMTLYSKELFEALTQEMLELGADDELAADWDVLVTMLSGSGYVGKLLPGVDLPTTDTRIRREYPEVYTGGDDTLFAEEMKAWPPVVVIFVSWANVQGRKERFGPDQQAIFDRFHRTVEKHRHFLRPRVVDISEKEPTPISTLYDKLELQFAREYMFPYYKRSWSSKRMDLADTDYSKVVADHIDETASGLNGVKVGIQVELIGGRHSSLRTNDPQGQKGVSMRDGNVLMGTLAFYKDFMPWKLLNPEKRAWRFQTELGRKMVGPTGIFSTEERRLIWGPFTSTSRYAAEVEGEVDTEKDMEGMSKSSPGKKTWELYYDSREKYERLVGIKRRLDPHGVFTTSAFSVGGRPHLKHVSDPGPEDSGP